MSSDPTFAYMKEKLQEVSDAQTMTVYCNFCPKFTATGTARETMIASAKHLREKHPDVIPKKRIARRRRAFSQAMTVEREEQIEEERRQRMRALGLSD